MDKNLDATGYGISLFSPVVLQDFLQKQKIRSKKLLEKFQKDKELYLTTQKEGIWLPIVQIASVHYLVKLDGYDDPFDDAWQQMLHYEGFNMEVKDALWVTAIDRLQPFDAGAFSGSKTSFQTRDGVTCYTGFKYEVPSGKYLVSVTGYARKQQVEYPEPNLGFLFSLVKTHSFDGYKNPRESDDYEFDISWLVRSKEAVIYWFSEAEGGRKQPPEDTTYSAAAELPDGNMCNLHITFDRKNKPQNQMEDKCRVDYLIHMKNFPPLESGMELILCDETRKRGKSVYQKVGRLVVK